MAKKPALFSLSSHLAERRGDLAQARKKIADITAHQTEFAAAVAVVNVAGKVASLHGCDRYASMSTEIWAHWDGTMDLTLRASFEGNVSNFKEGTVPAVLEGIMAAGFEAKKTEDYASEYSAQREYRFEQKVGPVRVVLNFSAVLKEENDSCRKVQVGTELREVPKFEIVCS